MVASVEKIYITRQRRQAPQAVDSVKLEAGRGILGDRYHHRAAEDEVQQNHLSLISKEELDAFLARHKVEIEYGNFRRNILTTGIDLNSLLGKRFKVGQALCQGIELCEPCAFLAATVHRAVLPELEEKAGIRAIILEGGNLQVGNTIVPVKG